MRDRFVIDTAFKVVEQQQGCLHAVSSFMCAFVVNTDKPVYLTDGPTGASTCLGAEVPIPCCVVAMLYVRQAPQCGRHGRPSGGRAVV